jgi:hypothetical protein
MDDTRFLDTLKSASLTDVEYGTGRDPEKFPPIKVYIYTGEWELKELEMYPYSTLEEIKQAIFTSMDADPDWLPKFQFLAYVAGETPVSEPTIETLYYGADFTWFDNTLGPDPIILPSPLFMVTSPEINTDFVTPDGQWLPTVQDNPKSRMTLDDVAFERHRGKGIPTFHVFSLRPLLSKFGRAITERDWNGRFAMYFHDVPMAGPYEPTDADMSFAEDLRQYIEGRTLQRKIVDSVISGDNYDTSHIYSIQGIRHLRLVWEDDIPEFKSRGGISKLFYNAPVTELRPFFRLVPVEGSPLIKLYWGSTLPTPLINDPNILTTWISEDTPGIDHSYLFVKFLVYPGSGAVNPQYSTVRIFEGGSADVTLMPNKHVEYLDPLRDLDLFYARLKRAMKGFPYTDPKYTLTLGGAALRLNVRLTNMKEKTYTAEELMERVRQYLSSFFQIIEPVPLPGSTEQPVLMLRYKAVSNFMTDSRVGTYLTILQRHDIANGTARTAAEYAHAAALEFGLTSGEADTQYRLWVEKKNEVAVKNAETGVFMEMYNAGTDIAIFESFKAYNVDIYHVESPEDLRRIYMCLRVLLSGQLDEYDELFEDAGLEVFERQARRVEDEAILRANGVPEAVTAAAATPPVRSLLGLSRPGAAASAMANTDLDGLQEDIDEAAIPGKLSALATSEGPGSASAAIPTSRAAAPGIVSAYANNDEEDENEFNVFNEFDDEEPVPELKKSAAAVAAAVAPPVAPTPPPKAAEPVSTAAPTPLGTDKGKAPGVKFKGWTLDTLKKVDNVLFGYTPKIAKTDGFSRKCGATDDRQPFALNEMEYQRFLETYADDMNSSPPRLIVKKYPLDPGDKERTPPREDVNLEVYTVLQYGSNPARQNYYICPKYFCLHDRIPVLEEDFDKAGARGDPRKPANACPFCYGGKITERAEATKGRTVIYRKYAPNTKKQHRFVGFLKDAQHPDGFEVPCCFGSVDTSDKLLSIQSSAYQHVRDFNQKLTEPTGGPGGPSAAPEKPTVAPAIAPRNSAMPYLVALQQLSTLYIKKREKYPLRPTQFGLLNENLDWYFKQNSASLVNKQKQVLLENSKGFLRMGVDNTNINESLFAVLVPLFYKNSVSEIRGMFDQFYTPVRFISSHYGNLVNEFYNPTDIPADPTELRKFNNRVREFAFQYIYNSESDETAQIVSHNELQIRRIYIAYNNFKDFLIDPTRRKELRHLTPILAELGLHLIVLDIDPNNPKKKPVIRCPALGVHPERHKNLDIAFVSRDPQGVFELLIHTYNCPPRGAIGTTHEFTVRFEKELAPTWPPIARMRREEFLNVCKGPGHGAYTGMLGVKVDTDSITAARKPRLIPLSVAIKQATKVGVVRDAYNHVVAITKPIGLIKTPDGRMKTSSQIVTIPVIDDGYIVKDGEAAIYLDYKDYKPVSIENAEKKLREFTDKLHGRIREDVLADYTIIAVLERRRADGSADASYAQLKNRTVIPIADLDEAAITGVGNDRVYTNGEVSYPVKTMEETDFEINKRVLEDVKMMEEGQDVEKGPAKFMALRTSRQELEDLYQHFRLIVSSWLAGTPAVRAEVSKIVDEVEENIYIGELDESQRLSLDEKRMRLQVLIGGFLMNFMVINDEIEDDEPLYRQSFLRRTCIDIQERTECKGACTWRAGEGDEGRCLLHVRDDVEVGRTVDEQGRQVGETIHVSTADLFIRRVIDELVRFPVKRAQIINDTVSDLTVITRGVRIDDQYVVPQKSYHWIDLFARLSGRLAGADLEKPRFYEEFGRGPEEMPTDITRMEEPLYTAPEAAEPTSADIAAAAAAPASEPESPEPQVYMRPIERTVREAVEPVEPAEREVPTIRGVLPVGAQPAPKKRLLRLKKVQPTEVTETRPEEAKVVEPEKPKKRALRLKTAANVATRPGFGRSLLESKLGLTVPRPDEVVPKVETIAPPAPAPEPVAPSIPAALQLPVGAPQTRRIKLKTNTMPPLTAPSPNVGEPVVAPVMPALRPALKRPAADNADKFKKENEEEYIRQADEEVKKIRAYMEKKRAKKFAVKPTKQMRTSSPEALERKLKFANEEGEDLEKVKYISPRESPNENNNESDSSTSEEEEDEDDVEIKPEEYQPRVTKKLVFKPKPKSNP